MGMEITMPSGTIPFQTSTSHEFPTVANPSLVDRSRDFHVHAHWHTQGSFFLLLNQSAMWKGEVILEEMGAGEFSGGPFITKIPVVGTLANQHFALLVNLPANSVPAGVYRVILKMSLDTSAFIPSGWTPICGFDDMGLVEFYN